MIKQNIFLKKNRTSCFAFVSKSVMSRGNKTFPSFSLTSRRPNLSPAHHACFPTGKFYFLKGRQKKERRLGTERASKKIDFTFFDCRSSNLSQKMIKWECEAAPLTPRDFFCQ